MTVTVLVSLRGETEERGTEEADWPTSMWKACGYPPAPSGDFDWAPPCPALPLGHIALLPLRLFMPKDGEDGELAGEEEVLQRLLPLLTAYPKALLSELECDPCPEEEANGLRLELGDSWLWYRPSPRGGSLASLCSRASHALAASFLRISLPERLCGIAACAFTRPESERRSSKVGLIAKSVSDAADGERDLRRRCVSSRGEARDASGALRNLFRRSPGEGCDLGDLVGG